MFILGFVLSATTIIIGKILVGLGLVYGTTLVREWLLPGNEAKLMEAMKKLKMKKDSAEAQFLEELTLAETAEMAAEFKKQMGNDSVAANSMLQSIMSQDTSYQNTIPTQGGGTNRPEGVPGLSEPLPPRQLRGGRQDTESMQAAVASLQSKTANHDRLPATLRLTGRPTHA